VHSDPFLFVSHVTENAAAALEIVCALERRGVRCWIAPRDVRPGRRFDDEISDALDGCRAMLLIFSEHCNNKDYIYREVTVAGENHKIIIPFRVDDAQPQRGLRVRLSDLQWINGFASPERAIDELVQTLRPSLEREPSGSLSAEERREAEREERAAEARRKVEEVKQAEEAEEARRKAATERGAAEAQREAGGAEEQRAARVRRKTPNAWLLIAGVSAVLVTCVVVYLMQGPSAVEALANGQRAESQKDYAQALNWYRKAADHGNSDAQAKIGDFYWYGRGVGQDYFQAMDWYRKAAGQGNAYAEYSLGYLFEFGQGVAQDYAQAVAWYRKAADQGNADAQNSIGNLYRYGRGVAQDYFQAMDWYRKAADQGNASAQASIGYLYEHGQGVGQDYVQAIGWYRKAADQGYADAQASMGYLYDNGLGVARDVAEARKWMQKAAENGNNNAKDWLKSH